MLVELSGISKSYNGVEALSRISFSVEEGEMFGIIGPDGSGKTTLLRILATLILPDSGKATIDGLDVVDDYRQIRNMLGYMPGKFSLYHDLTVEENLKFFAGVFNSSIEANYHLIGDVYKMLEPFKNRKAGKLSGGMKQKLALSCALIHKPKLLILDEPTTGIDAVSRKELWVLLKHLRNEGITILVSTAYMDEASMCGRVALINKGEVFGISSPNEFAQQYSKPLFSIEISDLSLLLNKIRGIEHCAGAYFFGSSLHYTSNNPNETAQSLAHSLHEIGIENATVKPIQASIEDYFIEKVAGSVASSSPIGAVHQPINQTTTNQSYGTNN